MRIKGPSLGEEGELHTGVLLCPLSAAAASRPHRKGLTIVLLLPGAAAHFMPRLPIPFPLLSARHPSSISQTASRKRNHGTSLGDHRVVVLRRRPPWPARPASACACAPSRPRRPGCPPCRHRRTAPRCRPCCPAAPPGPCLRGRRTSCLRGRLRRRPPRSPSPAAGSACRTCRERKQKRRERRRGDRKVRTRRERISDRQKRSQSRPSSSLNLQHTSASSAQPLEYKPRAPSPQLLRCAALEEPVEPEPPAAADLCLEVVPGSVAELVGHAEDEAVLLLGVCLALVGAVGQLREGRGEGRN